MTDTDLRQLFDDLVRLETDLWNAIDARLQRDCTTSLGELNVLLVLDRTPGCRVNDVAAALSITIGGASQAIDRLEKRGGCTRRPSPTDRRSSILALTASGRKRLRTAGPIFDQELQTRLGDQLPAPALNRLALTLGRLRAVTPPTTDPS